MECSKPHKRSCAKPTGKVISVAFAIDSRLLASSSHESDPDNGRIVLWQTGDWRIIREFSAKVGDYGPLIFEPGSNYLISCRAQKWDVDTGRELKPDLPFPVNWMALTPDKTGMIMMGSGDTVEYLHLSDHKLTEYRDVHQDSGRATAYSPDGKYLATGSDDVVLWDVATMTNLARF
jgi:WD40 repeat protein